jgi:predicted RNA binding protein YcfA (HicA-like mRNA interferase family)
MIMSNDVDALEAIRREIQAYPRLLAQKALIAIARRQGWSLDHYHGSHAILRYDGGGYGHLCIQHDLQNQTTRLALERIYRPQRDQLGADAAQGAAFEALQTELAEALATLQREWETVSHGQLAELAERLAAYERARTAELDRAVGELLSEQGRAILWRETQARLVAQETIQALRRRERALFQRLHQRDRENQKLTRQLAALQRVRNAPPRPPAPSATPAIAVEPTPNPPFPWGDEDLKQQIDARDRRLRRYRLGLGLLAIVWGITLALALERRPPKPAPQPGPASAAAIAPLI